MTTDILVPFEQEGTKAIVRSWLKQIGDTVAVNDPLVELETDKVTQEVPAPVAGVLVEILLDSDAEAKPGTILGRIAPAGAATAPEPAPAPAKVETTAPITAEPPAAAASVTGLSPAVRRAVKQHQVDPATIAGTGRGGRVTRADVDRAVAERGTAPVVSVAPASAPAPAPIASGSVQTVPHDRMRTVIAQNMLHSVTVAPHVTAVFECDFSRIMAHRRKHKAAYEAGGAPLTFTAYFIAAIVEAMKVAPAINSRWYDDRLEIYGDVGVGVGTALGDKGLVVPVVARAQELSLRGIAGRLGDLTSRARTGKLVPADMAGGTFTISNHGVSGSLLATPIIILQPQSAILGVGKLEKRVVVREVDGVDTIQIRPLAYVSLTIDHRVVDGHQTNSWLTRFVEVIENWPIEG
jgi:2-oxoglutarate dehydrogenase E2 component (dihydrolipoamide succinyltransferase)